MSLRPVEAAPGDRALGPRASRALAVGFLLSALAPLLAQGLGAGDDVRVVERRDPAPPPVLDGSAEAWRGFPAAFDAWARDALGLRGFLIRADSLVRYGLGVSATDRLIVGRDGWLFLGDPPMIRGFRGLRRFSPEQLERWTNRVGGYRDWLEARGAHLVVAIVPDKSTIYPEKMPRRLVRVSERSQLDQLLEHLRLARPELEVLDLRAPLRTEKDTGQLYLALDSHWSHLGAFVGYREIMARLRAHEPSLRAFALEDYEPVHKVWSASLGGPRMLRLDGWIEEGGFHLRSISQHPVLTRERLDDHHPVSTVVTTTVPDPAVRVLILGDSFIQATIPFFEHSLPFLVVADRRRPRLDRSLVERFEPDLVVLEIVERNLAQVVGGPVRE